VITKKKVVNGILCWKSNLKGEWIPFSPEAMTATDQQRLEKELNYFKERFKFVVTPE
jgi:hypothetical protein